MPIPRHSVGSYVTQPWELLVSDADNGVAPRVSGTAAGLYKAMHSWPSQVPFAFLYG